LLKETAFLEPSHSLFLIFLSSRAVTSLCLTVQ
jgi:hypothetical protein